MLLRFFRSRLPHAHPIRRVWSFLRGWSAAILYGFPAKKLRVIGVTGTDGKTTTVHFIATMLTDAGFRVGSISSALIRKGTQTRTNTTKRTSLDPFVTQRFLRDLVTEGFDTAVLEVSSHALVQGRMAGIPFDIGVVLNLSHEHLDYHKTMQNYAMAKRRLLENVVQFLPKPSIEKRIVIGADLPFFEQFFTIAPAITTTFSDTNPKAKIRADAIAETTNGTRFWCIDENDRIEILLPVPGRFQVKNALAAAAVGRTLHLDLPTIKKGLQSVSPVPGRMEEICEGQRFRFFVDYALTPGAFRAMLSSARQMTSGQVIVVFGSAGGAHTPAKRPMLGAIAGELADLSIITEDENYGEPFSQIAAMIVEGFTDTPGRHLVVPDRREAIETAIDAARDGDIVVVTGMANLPTRTMENGEEMPWNEAQICREELQKQKKRSENGNSF